MVEVLTSDSEIKEKDPGLEKSLSEFRRPCPPDPGGQDSNVKIREALVEVDFKENSLHKNVKTSTTPPKNVLVEEPDESIKIEHPETDVKIKAMETVVKISAYENSSKNEKNLSPA